MKKVFCLLVMLVLVTSFAIAQQGVHDPGTGIENPELKEAAQGTGQGGNAPEVTAAEQGQQQGEAVQTQAQEQQQNLGEGQQIRARNQEMLETGLQNALGRVTNENARQRLQQNIDKFQQKYQERMQRMENVEIGQIDEETGAVQVKAKERVKYFGFINGKATKKFNIDNNGNIEEKAPWYRFMYKEVSE